MNTSFDISFLLNEMEFLEQFKMLNWLGALTLVVLTSWWSVRILNILRLYLDSCRPPNSRLSSYGEWALITGSSDGIGRAFAIELAKRGLNIILISFVEEELKSTAIEIEEQFGVKTSYIVADFRNRDCYKHIKQNIEGKDIGILVNNVGTSEQSSSDYGLRDEDAVWTEIDVNCGAIAQMTRIILPMMKSKKKGMIVNIGSLTVLCQHPYLGIYPATKSFVATFSSTLQMEMKEFNIKVRCITPYWTETKLTKILSPIFAEFTRIAPFLVPGPVEYARSAVASLDTDYLFSAGYWVHSIIELILEVLPECMRTRLVYAQTKYYVNKLSSNDLEESGGIKKRT